MPHGAETFTRIWLKHLKLYGNCVGGHFSPMEHLGNDEML